MSIKIANFMQISQISIYVADKLFVYKIKRKNDRKHAFFTTFIQNVVFWL
jgi:hypothetical protein